MANVIQRQNRMKVVLLRQLKISLEDFRRLPLTIFVKVASAFVTIVLIVAGSIPLDENVQLMPIVTAALIAEDQLLLVVVAHALQNQITMQGVAVIILVCLTDAVVADVLIAMGGFKTGDHVQLMLIVIAVPIAKDQLLLIVMEHALQNQITMEVVAVIILACLIDAVVTNVLGVMGNIITGVHVQPMQTVHLIIVIVNGLDLFAQVQVVKAHVDKTVNGFVLLLAAGSCQKTKYNYMLASLGKHTTE